MYNEQDSFDNGFQVIVPIARFNLRDEKEIHYQEVQNNRKYANIDLLEIM